MKKLENCGLCGCATTKEDSVEAPRLGRIHLKCYDDSLVRNKPNFEQGFENGDPASFTNSEKFVHSSPTTSRFALETTVGYTGSNCYKAPIATGSAAGNTYSITLPSFDISGMGASTPRFTFYSSYAQPDATVTETMRVYVSTDCGASFKQILERSGAALAYSGQVYTNNFKPTKSTNWRLSGVTSLSSIGYGLNQNLTFRIDVISGGGNPVYIDNINISKNKFFLC
jgi:hypothetical protein